MQFQEVKFGAVAFVLAEAIFRETRAEVAHNRVARDLRDHARGRDAQAVAVAVDDGGLGKREGENRQAIDEDMLRLQGEARNCDSHRLVGRAQNIYQVDLDGVDYPNRPCDFVLRDQIVVNLFAFLREKLLRIVQLFVPEFLGKDNCRGYDWTGERAAAGFVDAGNGRDTKGAEFSFMPESATAIHEGKILKT